MWPETGWFLVWLDRKRLNLLDISRRIYTHDGYSYLIKRSLQWRHNEHDGLLCGEFTGNRWILRTKATDAELWCFLWSAPEYFWVNNREAGDSRCHRAHYDVTLNVHGESTYTDVIHGHSGYIIVLKDRITDWFMNWKSFPTNAVMCPVVC